MERRSSSEQAKRRALQRAGVLHPHPERVQDPRFRSGSAFFDPHDAVQVKYEMLRAHHVEGLPAAEAARRFGFSRQTLYTVAAAFWRSGLLGLLPRRRGPKGPHKLTPEMVGFLESEQRQDPRRGLRGLADAVAQRFGVRLHPRTVQRALEKKKRPDGAQEETGDLL